MHRECVAVGQPRGSAGEDSFARGGEAPLTLGWTRGIESIGCKHVPPFGLVRSNEAFDFISGYHSADKLQAAAVGFKLYAIHTSMMSFTTAVSSIRSDVPSST